MYIFRKQIFGFMDLLRFKKMVPKRRAKLAEGSAEPIPKTYLSLIHISEPTRP